MLNKYWPHIDQSLLISLPPTQNSKFCKHFSVYDQAASLKSNANNTSAISRAFLALGRGHSAGRTQLFP